MQVEQASLPTSRQDECCARRNEIKILTPLIYEASEFSGQLEQQTPRSLARESPRESTRRYRRPSRWSPKFGVVSFDLVCSGLLQHIELHQTLREVE